MSHNFSRLASVFIVFSLLHIVRNFAVAEALKKPPELELRKIESKVMFSDSELTLQAEVVGADQPPFKDHLRYDWRQTQGAIPAKIEQEGNRVRISGLKNGSYGFLVSVTFDGEKKSSSVSSSFEVVKKDSPAGTFLKSSDLAFVNTGRFLRDAEGRTVFGWPGSSVRMNFQSRSVRVLLKDGSGTPSLWYAIIDGQDKQPVVIGGDGRTDFLVSDKLAPGKHSLELFRLTGAWAAETTFSGVILESDGKADDPPAHFQRRIEFYGDSITEGSYMDDQPFANNYLAFAATTARLLGAESSQICRGGIGLVKGFALPLTLPVIYDRTLMGRENEPWDFNKWIPHVVVINILQNDKWTNADPEIAKKAYLDLIGKIRAKYPKAFIVCAIGSMDAVQKGSPWPNFVQEVVKEAVEKLKDNRIDFFAFDFIGGSGHPTSVQARRMAEKLVDHLERKKSILWVD